MVTQLKITDKRKEIAEQEIRDKRKDVKYITLDGGPSVQEVTAELVSKL